MQKLDDFYNENILKKRTIGIHLRGTDKQIEVKPNNPLLLIKDANKNKNCQFFIQTDEYSLLELAKKNLNGKIIHYTYQLSQNCKTIHYTQHLNKAILGEEILIEAILLSKCDKFIHTLSNVSTAVVYFNPNIKHIVFDKNKVIFRND